MSESVEEAAAAATSFQSHWIGYPCSNSNITKENARGCHTNISCLTILGQSQSFGCAVVAAEATFYADRFNAVLACLFYCIVKCTR